MSPEPKPRPLNHLWNTAQVVGVVVTLTGLTPDRWMTAFLDAVKLPDWLFAGIDVRFIAVGIGVAIIATDAFLRHRRASQQQFHAAAAAPLVAVTPVSTEPPVTATPPPTEAIEPIKDKPSIAVLPFVNMSDDKSQEYFADGMTEDIITGLSCDSRLFVIARNSTFAYKGQSPDIRTVGKELGVRYVLEGSIRPIGDRLRITMQLIETASGTHVWADKIDRPVAELFAIMDEVVDGLVMTLCSNLGVAEGKRAARQRPEDLKAWALCVQAEVLYFSQVGPKYLAEAEKLARRATEIEPGYAVSWALLGALYGERASAGLSVNLARDAEEAMAFVNTALSLAPGDPVVLGYCGSAAITAGHAAQAIDYLARSLAINPNSSFSRLYYGFALWADARPAEEGIAQLELFIRRSPKDPYMGLAYLFLSACHLTNHDPQQAEQTARSLVRHWPGSAWSYAVLVLSLAALGRDAEARQQLPKVRELAPGLTGQYVADLWRHLLPHPEQAEIMVALTRRVWSD
ncbi:MAG: tetratricopeptide repeat protein [Gammaproteobacteria bacterium]